MRRAILAAVVAAVALAGCSGTLSAEWDGLEASWTYHPDDGISLIVTEVD